MDTMLFKLQQKKKCPQFIDGHIQNGNMRHSSNSEGKITIGSIYEGK